MDPVIPPATVAERVERDTHLLLWQVHGTGEYRIGGAVFGLTPDQALWVPAGVPHEIALHADSVLFPLCFDARRRTLEPRETAILEVTAEMRLLCQTLMQMQATLIRPDADVEGDLLRMIETANRGSDLPLPTSPAARRVALSLRLDPGDRRSSREWAAAGHVSVRTLERSFADETGMTLREWRTACRIGAAQAMLRRGGAVSSVAHRVGYADASSFGRAFLARTGVTPGEYVRECREAGAPIAAPA